MGSESPKLRRGFYGYRPELVHRLLAQRDELMGQVEAQARAAQARVGELEQQVAASAADAAAARQEVASFRDEAERLRAAGPEQTGARFLSEELSTILAAAEESANRIIERARVSTQQQVQEADRLWREVQAELTRFATWRDRVDPAIRSAQARLTEVRGQAEEIPERIRRALTPMAEAIAAMDTELAGLGAVTTPPLLVAPRGLEGPEPSPSSTGQDPSSQQGGAGPVSPEPASAETPPGPAAVQPSPATGQEPGATPGASPGSPQAEREDPSTSIWSSPRTSAPSARGRAQGPGAEGAGSVDPAVAEYLPPIMGLA